MSVSQRPESSPTAQDEPPLSLAEARAVKWQVAPYEPMGRMFDGGRLRRKELEWAVEKAYRPDVRRAARRLLAELDKAHAAQPPVQEPPPAAAPSIAPAPQRPASTAAPSPDDAEDSQVPRHGPRVITASEYLEEQQEHSFGLFSYGIGMAFIAAAWMLTDLVRNLMTASPLQIGLSLTALALSAVIAISYIRKHGRAWRNARAGRKGEEKVLNALRESLDSRWTIFRNLQLPDRKADMDLVLVGSGGVWCVQIKAYSAPLRYRDGRWEYQRGKRWRPCDPTFDPEKGVTRQALQLHDFLARAGVDRFVERAIALAESIPANAVATSPIPVWLPFDIRQRVAALTTRTPMAEAEQARVNELLERRAVEQRAVEADRRRKVR